MGAHLPPQDAPFNFILEAKADPMSKPLERLQLVKGWVDASGQKHNRVIDVMTANTPMVQTDCAPYFQTRIICPTQTAIITFVLLNKCHRVGTKLTAIVCPVMYGKKM